MGFIPNLIFFSTFDLLSILIFSLFHIQIFNYLLHGTLKKRKGKLPITSDQAFVNIE